MGQIWSESYHVLSDMWRNSLVFLLVRAQSWYKTGVLKTLLKRTEERFTVAAHAQ